MTTPSELRGLSERATPGEWSVNKYGSIGAGEHGIESIIAKVEPEYGPDAYHGNARFIAACVNEIRRQLSEGPAISAAELLERYDAWMQTIPVGDHSVQRGDVSYNWHRHAHWKLGELLKDAALSAQHQGERSE